MEIQELQPPNETGFCYAEGIAETLALLPENRRTLAPERYTWFCFEEPWVGTCMILQVDLRFTATQILEAREQSEGEGS